MKDRLITSYDAQSRINEPMVVCPNCKTEVKLTESLAAPLIEATRQQFNQKIAEKEADVAIREAAVRNQLAELATARESFDEQVTARLNSEREKIAAEEAVKARLVLSNDIDQKTRELASLHDVLKERNAKLAEAQNAQADLIRKEREL